VTAIETRPATGAQLSVVQVAALAVAALCPVAYVGGGLLGLVRGSFFFWWRPDILGAGAFASVGVFLLSHALRRWGERPREGTDGSRLWATERWPAWLAAGVGCGGVVLYTLLGNRWLAQFDLADAGLPVADTSPFESLALLVLSPLMVLAPLLAAGVVWRTGRRRR